MSVMVNNVGGDNAEWKHALSALLPELSVYAYPEIPDKSQIKYAAVWYHPHNDLLQYPNLKAVLVLGAGTDHIDQAPALPDVPIVRLIDPAVGTDMSQYVLYWTMHFQRGYETYRKQQLEKVWQRYEYPLAKRFTVTVLGAGLIGSFIAQQIALCGFNAQVWSRSPREDVSDDITYHHGEQGLQGALSNTNVLVNCLPLKPQTRGLIDADLLQRLPIGGYFINVSRGAVVNEEDLIEALNTKHLQAAAIDAATTEPLSEAHPFWTTPNLFVTPHMSGATYTRTAARVLADNIKRMERGDDPFPIYTPSQRGA